MGMTFPSPPDLFNLAQYVLSANVAPDKSALEILGVDARSFTYAELKTSVEELAAKIAAQTPTAGDRILLRLGNHAQFPLSYLAAIAADRVPVVTSAHVTQVEVDAIAVDTQPSLVIADPDLPVPLNIPALKDTAVEFPGYALGDPNRPAYIVYTSGTSGRPMPVVHAHRAIWARQSMISDWYDLSQSDRVLHAGAFNWTYTLGTGLLDPWTVGATALIPHDGTPASEIPNMLLKSDATIFAASPGVYRRVIREQIPRLPKLRHALSAGEKLPANVKDAWEGKTETLIHEAYGLSECSTFISGSPENPAPAGTIGTPQSGRKVALLSDGKPSETGTIAISRDDPGVMLGYLNHPQETSDRFDGDWFLTGDLARRTSTGAFEYLGRSDDMMNAGGHRVSPIEVETALLTCAEITDAACAEVRLKPDLSLIAAFYVAPNVIDEDVLNATLQTQLADYKRPRLFIRLDTLPRGNNNKLLRKQLRENWERDHGQT